MPVPRWLSVARVAHGQHRLSARAIRGRAPAQVQQDCGRGGVLDRRTRVEQVRRAFAPRQHQCFKRESGERAVGNHGRRGYFLAAIACRSDSGINTRPSTDRAATSCSGQSRDGRSEELQDARLLLLPKGCRKPLDSQRARRGAQCPCLLDGKGELSRRGVSPPGITRT